MGSARLAVWSAGLLMACRTPHAARRARAGQPCGPARAAAQRLHSGGTSVARRVAQRSHSGGASGRGARNRRVPGRRHMNERRDGRAVATECAPRAVDGGGGKAGLSVAGLRAPTTWNQDVRAVTCRRERGHPADVLRADSTSYAVAAAVCGSSPATTNRSRRDSPRFLASRQHAAATSSRGSFTPEPFRNCAEP